MYSCMFAGQGAQYEGMGVRIAQSSKEAARLFTIADSILGMPVSDLCFKGTLEQLTPCAVCQPTIFVTSMALYAAFREQRQDTPAACAGLSLGEYAAACAAGVMDFETALRLVARRGALMDACCKAHPGGMAAVLGADVAVVEDAASQADVDVANYNCPGQLVISGENSGLDRACALLEAKGLRCVRLTVAGAYHSRLMEPAAQAFAEDLDKAVISTPKCTFAQNVAGDAVADPDGIRKNLRLQISSSVRWESCVRVLMAKSAELLEFGPGKVLCGFMKRIDRNFPARALDPALVAK